MPNGGEPDHHINPTYATLRFVRGTMLALPTMQNALDVVDLTIDLMWIESTSGNEGNVIDFVEKLLASRGWRTTLIPVSAGRNDVFATVSDAPLVTLSTHLDTVPP